MMRKSVNKRAHRANGRRALARKVDAHVAQRLRLAREMRGRSLAEIGEALGVSFQQMQKYETGSVRVGAGRLFHLSRLLSVPIAFFYDGAPGLDHGEDPALIVDLSAMSSAKSEAVRLISDADDADVDAVRRLLARLRRASMAAE
jgi:transcriptional regulator with XRE-family HTH domain